ncbi:MAG: type IV pilus secretin PilQ [Nitrospirae bacterium]|nr:type IV pilus secretin PilQ [Nitrospirota bacterium]
MKKMYLTIGVMLIIFGLFACSPKASQVKDTSAEKKAGAAKIAKIDVKDLGDKTQLIIEGDSVLSYTTFKLSDPLRLVIDFSDATLGAYKDKIIINQGAITDIIPSEIGEPRRIARLEIALSQLVDSNVRQEGQRIIVDVEKPKVSEAEGAPKITEVPLVKEEPLKPQPSEITGKAAAVLSKLDVKREDAVTRVIVSGDGEINANTMMVSGNRLVVDVPNTVSNIKPQIISVNNHLLKRVRIGQHTKPEKKVRIVLDLTAQLFYNLSKENNKLIVTISKEAAVAKKEDIPPSEVKEPAAEPKGPIIAAKELEKPVKEAKPKEEMPPAPKEEIAIQPEKLAEKPVPAVPKRAVTEKDIFTYKEVVPSKRYTGKRISLDFQDADIRNILRLIADVSGYNLAAGDDVKGKVTIKLLNVPWDQALDILLKMNNFGYLKEGNIIRVATLKNIEDQLTAEAKAREAEQKAGELITKIIYINYGSAKDFIETLKRSLSPRGSIVVEDKTNAMIVKDIAKSVDEITEMVRTLDRKVPQVMIEARIVEADTTYVRELGVQWGADQSGWVTSRSGRRTGSYSIYGGGTKEKPGNTTYTPLTNGFGVNDTGFLVNLPSAVGAGSGGAIGVMFSNLAQSFNLDFQLSAMESNGKGKVLSNPKILALNNKEAYIQTGYRIPYESTSTQGTKTEWVDAVLQLKVTPHVTPDNHIMMSIKVEKNEPDFANRAAGNAPTITTKEAKTDVLVNNGDTLVIGGIYKKRSDDSVRGVPWFSRIPILGWLFKKEYIYDKPEELVIFITPKITKLEAL